MNRKKKFFSALLLFCAIFLLCTSMNVSAATAGFRKNSKGVYYKYASGAIAKGGFKKIGNYYYYFTNAGYVKTGWLTIGSKTYYMQASGALGIYGRRLTGYHTYHGVKYYFTAAGVLVESKCSYPTCTTAFLTNMIGAVESGGQVYGKRDYSAYAPAYNASSLEVTCTLGWAQNYGLEARKLIQMIYAADKTAFLKADTANIVSKLNVDWVAEQWNPSSAEKQALIAIITTAAGKKCQDQLFAELAKTYIAHAKAYGLKNGKSIAMWCEIEHLGGLSAAKRIFNKTAKPYTIEQIMKALKTDQADTSSDNQVGDAKYQSRHNCCYTWINKYL